jgi:hypothetical protein
MEVKGYLEEDKKYVEQNNPVGGNMNRSSRGHMELALRMLEEAREYVPEGDAVQASEKLYKAAEESLKSITYGLGLDVAKAADERGLLACFRCCYSYFGEGWGDVAHWWDSAWVLHVEVFHEVRLSIKHVNTRIGDVERIVKLARRLDMLKPGETKPCMMFTALK